MLIIKLLHFLRGYLKIKLTGSFLERFINICINRNIYIWNIKNKGNKTMTACISIKGFKRIRDICAKTSTRVHILSKKGLPFLLAKFFRRKGLIIGLGIFIFLIVWLCSNIWYVEVADIEGVDKSKIMMQLEKSGVHPGMPIYSINPDKIQAEMLNQNSDLSWLWPEVKGTKVFVDYRVRVKKPDIIDVNKPCNLIAKRSGRVTDMIVKEGRKVVSKDMWVSEGQLLVSGIFDSKAVGVRYVHADGEIWVDTDYTLSGSYLLKPTVTQKTGRYSSRYTFNIGKNSFNLPIPYTHYAAYTEKTENYPMKIGDIYFPFSITKMLYYETADKQLELPREQIINEAEDYLIKVLQKEIENGIIKEKNFSVNDIDENTIEIKLNALCKQQIAQKQPIEGDTKDNGRENN